MDLSERGSASSRHPWEIERLAAYRAVLAEHGALAARRVLDVGAGDGWFSESLLPSLEQVEQIVCWDINYNELELATHDPRIVRTTAAPSPGFDLVLVLDVLEHIDDPVGFIDRELRPLASPGTAVLAAVPANPRLFSGHDRALGHCRRYRADEFLEQLGGWVDVVDHGPLFVSLVPLRAASVAFEKLRGDDRQASHGVGSWNAGPAITRGVGAVLKADARVARRLGSLGRRLPGLSHWAFGRVR
jgi:SAM-dependent methyltransferase